ncbi:hypothetical protein MMC13_001816 [Lambiella insularis]|nr:hypothetical protein [Lambiella insularis]
MTTRSSARLRSRGDSSEQNLTTTNQDSQQVTSAKTKSRIGKPPMRSETLLEMVPETLPEKLSEILPETQAEMLPETLPEALPEMLPETLTEMSAETLPEMEPGDMPNEAIQQREISSTTHPVLQLESSSRKHDESQSPMQSRMHSNLQGLEKPSPPDARIWCSLQVLPNTLPKSPQEGEIPICYDPEAHGLTSPLSITAQAIAKDDFPGVRSSQHERLSISNRYFQLEPQLETDANEAVFRGDSQNFVRVETPPMGNPSPETARTTLSKPTVAKGLQSHEAVTASHKPADAIRKGAEGTEVSNPIDVDTYVRVDPRKQPKRKFRVPITLDCSTDDNSPRQRKRRSAGASNKNNAMINYASRKGEKFCANEVLAIVLEAQSMMVDMKKKMAEQEQALSTAIAWLATLGAGQASAKNGN